MNELYDKLLEIINDNFIKDNRWQYYVTGLGNTLLISFFALLIGVFIGFFVAIIRTSAAAPVRQKNAGYYLLFILDKICGIYITLSRGIPVVVQLMISYFVIFAFIKDPILPAIITFGINSGAYVAEIMRSGIMSIEKGQMEAGRSLGLNYPQTMLHIIMPQAIKNVLPALGNELIVLVKETSVVGYVGAVDLTKGANINAGILYKHAIPMLTISVIYLIIVLILTKLVGIMERRLRVSEH